MTKLSNPWDLGEVPGIHVECKGNPLDLRPAADAIIQQVLHAHEWASPSETIHVLMGEGHTTPAHGLLVQMVASRLLDLEDVIGKTAIGSEVPYNIQSESIRALSERADVDTEQLRINSDGAIDLLLSLSSGYYKEDTDARGNLMMFALENRISFRFNDASYLENRLLDPQDPLSQLAIEALARDPNTKDWNKQDLQVRGQFGMAVRNKVMNLQTERQLKKAEARVHIQHCGRAHVLGNIRPMSLAYSLAWDLLRQEKICIPVFHLDVFDQVKPQALAQYPYSVITSNLDDTMFDEYADKKALKQHMQTICDASGSEIGVFDISRRRPQRIEEACAMIAQAPRLS